MKKKILVVDDEKPIRELVRHKLSRQGYDVLTASDGNEFWDRATNERPDLLVLDIWLKDKSGITVYDELIRSGFDGDVPVIFITALDDKPPKHASPGCKYALYCKPINFDEFLSEVHTLLDERVRRGRAVSR